MSSPASISVLITVYHRILPDQLRACLASIHDQTLPPQHLVLVIDGFIPPELEEVLEEVSQPHALGDIMLHIRRLSSNQGSAAASNEGLEYIHGKAPDQESPTTPLSEWVARLDADDLAAPDRFEKQYAYVCDHPDIDIVGTSLAEFQDHPVSLLPSSVSESNESNGRVNGTVDIGTVDMEALRRTVIATRVLPASHHEIMKAVAMNNPFNHPSILVRRSSLESLGGYRHIPYMEDYDMCAHLLALGARGHNMEEALTFFRTSEAVFERRTAPGMFRAERSMQKALRDYGLISPLRSYINLIIRSTYRMLPSPLLHRAYRLLFHKRTLDQ